MNQLEMFLAVADGGSFGGAAAALGCTQSRISHAITELEQTLGAKLLLRSRTGCVPTEAGHLALAKARQIIQLTNSLRETADENAAVIGRVRIACFRSIGTHLLPQVLAALSIDYPGIRVDIDDSCESPDDVTTALGEARAEIGIAQLPHGPGFASRPFVSDDYVLVAPASLALRAPVSWEQFEALPYIQLACAGALAILGQCRAAGFMAEITRTLSTDSAIAAMIRHGMGYSILPRLAVFPDPEGVNIVALPIPAGRRFAVLALPQTARLKAVQIVTRYVRNRRIVTSSAAFRAGHFRCW